MKGVVLDRKAGTVKLGREGGSVAGAVARVETAGERFEGRFTATRLALIGPFALAFKKKKDHRELYLSVEGPGYAFVVKLDPDDGAKARGFAARVNSASSKTVLAAQQRAAVQAPPVQTPPRPGAARPDVDSSAADTGTRLPGFAGRRRDAFHAARLVPGPDRQGLEGSAWWDGVVWTEHVSG